MLVSRPPAPAAAGPRPKLSVVSTMYRSRVFLETFLAQSQAAVEALGISSYEIVLVNDGSPDDSLEYALACRERIRSLVVVDLSRNFGHHHAMHAGLHYARGELVFLIDCDLEVNPAVLADFYRRLVETGADMVFGYQSERKGGLVEKLGGAIFWKGFNALSETPLPENALTERIMTRRFIEAVLTLGDFNLFLGGMMVWAGFKQLGIPVKKVQRAGRSTYTLLKRFQLMVNAVSAFSSKPLVWLFNFGVMITLLSFTYAAYLLGRKVIFGDTLLGFTSLMTMMAATLGILTTALGIVGIYLGKIFNQVQNRPTFIVKDVHSR